MLYHVSNPCLQVRPVEFDTPSADSATAASSSSSTTTSTSAKPVKSVEITTTLVQSYETAAPLVASNSLSAGHVFRKSASPAPQAVPQPLQTSASNASPIVSSTSEELLKSTGVAPLGRADANSPGGVGKAGKAASDSAKALKRPAASAGTGEKRKKALKRL